MAWVRVEARTHGGGVHLELVRVYSRVLLFLPIIVFILNLFLSFDRIDSFTEFHPTA